MKTLITAILTLWSASTLCLTPAGVRAQGSHTKDELQEVFRDDFTGDADQWEMLDPECWKFKRVGDRSVLSLFKKQSSYQPSVRSPLHVALLKVPQVGDFQLDVRIQSTHEDYGHRDVCLFFGYQKPSQYYYVHLGKKADPHANQIFIVNEKPRTKISLTTTDGTPWDDRWHQVRVIRNIDSGDIQVFFDDMENPAMTANDKTFGKGRVGLGSFDDTADFDDFVLRAK